MGCSELGAHLFKKFQFLISTLFAENPFGIIKLIIEGGYLTTPLRGGGHESKVAPLIAQTSERHKRRQK